MRKVMLIAAGLLSSGAIAAPPADGTFDRETLGDVAGKIAGQCMNEGWTVTSQAPNQVTCQVPMNFGNQLMADLLLGNRYSTPTVTYVQFNMAQIGEGVRAQVRAWLENQSAFGQVRQTPVTDDKSRVRMLAFLETIGARVAGASDTTRTPGEAPRQMAPPAPPPNVDADNLRFVEAMANSGQCDVAQRFATNVNDPAVTARVTALCEAGIAKKTVLDTLPAVPDLKPSASPKKKR